MESEVDTYVSIEVEIENRIKLIEKNMIYLKNKKIAKKIKSESFSNQYKNYKFAINALMDEPNYYKVIRELVICENNSANDIEIFNSEHWDTIYQYKKFGKNMIKIFKIARKLDYITNFEYKILKKISKHIKNVWKTDEIFENMYLDKIYDIPTFKEVEFYFSVSDIIIAKLKVCNDIKINNQIEIIDNDYYMELINKLKKNLSGVQDKVVLDEW